MQFKLNKLLLTDSYKQTHHLMYREGLENISSYFESRKGARWPVTMAAGLQGLLKNWVTGVFFTPDDIKEADQICLDHFMGVDAFNRKMWEHIWKEHKGKLPVRIRAVPEGSVVPVGNMLMDIQVTDEGICAPLTNWLETILMHVWFPSNVATLGFDARQYFQKAFNQSVDPENHWKIDYLMHDFGFRGTECIESSWIGGGAHLINFKGTDTMPAIPWVRWAYNTTAMPAHSVLASEHSIKTSAGEEGEIDLVRTILRNHPNGILSDVQDSFNIQRMVEAICTYPDIRELILARNGKYVLRPDSPRWEGDIPAEQIHWIVDRLGAAYGTSTNHKGFRELNPKVGCIYGDGLSLDEIKESVDKLIDEKWAASECVYGMGGGLLQKHDRDTQRSAIKCSAQKIQGEWIDIYKKPTDITKMSKKGLMKLVMSPEGRYETVGINSPGDDLLRDVFVNGDMVNEMTHEEVVANARASIRI